MFWRSLTFEFVNSCLALAKKLVARLCFDVVDPGRLDMMDSSRFRYVLLLLLPLLLFPFPYSPIIASASRLVPEENFVEVVMGDTELLGTEERRGMEFDDPFELGLP